jgi:hypothetical protein
VIFIDVAVTVQILLNPSASNITPPSPSFIKFRFLLIIKFILLVPLYSPDAIMIVSLSLALFMASFNVLNAVVSLFPSPLLFLLPLTYHVIFLVGSRLTIISTVIDQGLYLSSPV